MKKIFITIILAVLMLMPNIAEAKVKIGEVEFDTFDEAMRQIKEGETVTLLDDVDVSDPNKYGNYHNWLFPDNATLDLNNHTIYTSFKGTVPNSVWLGNNLTIKNGTFETVVGADYSLFLGDEIETSGITLENITTTTGINIYNTLNATLKNVKATGGNTYYAVWLDEHATATILSGEFSSKGAATVGITTAENGFVSKLTIKGGRLIGEKGKLSLSESSNESKHVPPIIMGGTYDFDVTEFVSDGYESKKKDNLFVVMEKEYDREVKVENNITDIKVKLDNEAISKTLIEELKKTSEVDITKKDIDVALNIKDITPNAEIKNKISEKIKNGTIANYFDVSINVIDKSTNTIIGNLTELNNKITLSIEIPDSLKAKEGYIRKYYILREHNGVIEVLDTKNENGTLTFETNKFSTYALAYTEMKEEKPKDEIENPATEDKLKYNVLLMSCFAIVAIGGIIYLGKKEEIF